VFILAPRARLLTREPAPRLELLQPAHALVPLVRPEARAVRLQHLCHLRPTLLALLEAPRLLRRGPALLLRVRQRAPARRGARRRSRRRARACRVAQRAAHVWALCMLLRNPRCLTPAPCAAVDGRSMDHRPAVVHRARLRLSLWSLGRRLKRLKGLKGRDGEGGPVIEQAVLAAPCARARRASGLGRALEALEAPQVLPLADRRPEAVEELREQRALRAREGHGVRWRVAELARRRRARLVLALQRRSPCLVALPAGVRDPCQRVPHVCKPHPRARARAALAGGARVCREHRQQCALHPRVACAHLYLPGPPAACEPPTGPRYPGGSSLLERSHPGRGSARAEPSERSESCACAAGASGV